MVAGCEQAIEESAHDFGAEFQELFTDHIPPDGTVWLAKTSEVVEAVGIEAEEGTSSGVRFATLSAFESGTTFFGISFTHRKMVESAGMVHCSKNVSSPIDWRAIGRYIDEVLMTAMESGGDIGATILKYRVTARHTRMMAQSS